LLLARSTAGDASAIVRRYWGNAVCDARTDLAIRESPIISITDFRFLVTWPKRHAGPPAKQGWLESEMTSTVSRRFFTQCLVATALVPAPAFASEPIITVHKDPACDCCTGWVTHLERKGFRVQVIETQELNRVKGRLGVPSDLAACHTAEADGFVLVMCRQPQRGDSSPNALRLKGLRSPACPADRPAWEAMKKNTR
jgi:hypothetical protein